MAKFGEVLKNKNFFFLWLSQIISQFGDRLSQMALIALISARAPGSSFQLAKVFSLTIIPVFLVGPIAASYVDRWDRRRTMISCDVLRAVLVGSILFFLINSTSVWPIYILIFLLFSVSRFFVPAKMAIIPELVSQEKLLLANSLSSTTGMIAAVGGFALGGLLVEHLGSAGGFFVNVITYIVSGMFIFMITTRKHLSAKKESLVELVKDVEEIIKKTILAHIKEGWQYLVREKNMRIIARVFFLLGSAAGAVSVVAIVFVQGTLGSITRDLGFLAMFLAIGLFCGSLIYGRFGHGLSRMRIIFISLGASGIILGIFTVLLKIFASTLFAGSLSFVLGLIISPVIISSQTIVHEVSHENMRGRVFGSLEIVAHLAFLLFMFLSSFLADKLGRFWILLFVGAVLTVVGFGVILLKVDRRRT